MDSVDGGASDGGWAKGGTAARWGAIAVVVLAVGLISAILVLRSVVDADFLERRTNPALADVTDGRYRLEIGAVEWGVWIRSVRLRDVSLRADSVQAAGASERPGAEVWSLDVEGLHWWSLLWNRMLTVDRVVVRRPHFRLHGETSELRSDGPSTPSGALRGMTVHRLDVRGGRVTTNRDSVWGVFARFDHFSTRDTLAAKPRDVLVNHFVQGRVAGYRRTTPEQLYELRLGPVRVSRPDSVLTMAGVRVAPTVSDEAFLRAHDYRTNRIRATASAVEAEQVHVDRLMGGEGLLASGVRVDSMRLHVYRDNHRPEDPNDPPPSLPHELVQSLERTIQIDTMRIQNSRIAYVKRPENVADTGAISFENLWATAYNVKNDPAERTEATPVVIDVQAEVNGAGLLQTTLRVPLLTQQFSLSFDGRLGAMDATDLNETFVNLGGVRVERGQVDSLSFRASVEDGHATGTVRGVYRDLEIETLNKATGKRGFRNRLKTFLVNGLALRSTNVPGDGRFHEGTIDHVHSPDESFFKFLWLSLRSGLYSLVGVDRLPG